MSHRFKRPKPFTKQGRQEAEVRKLAGMVRDQAGLDELLDSCKPGLRVAVFERLRPHLGFENPVCGESQPPQP